MRDNADVQIWTSAFRLGETTLEALERELSRSDYAILVATADDVIGSRGEIRPAPRDNVIFEAGLFMGRLGRDRAFVLCDVASRQKLPTDWAGVTFAIYDGNQLPLKEALRPAANQISNVVCSGGLSAEVDFVRAYLRIIPSEIAVTDSYGEILERHHLTLKYEIERLRREKDWSRLLEVKKRLREYFEYSGRYSEGIAFGEAYVSAQVGLGHYLEANWSRVKDIGYMRILGKEHFEGRRIIKAAITELETHSADIDETERTRLLFYAWRYLGISYQRDDVTGNLSKAKECYSEAERLLHVFPEGSQEHRELCARILRNKAKVAAIEGQAETALSILKESLGMFVLLEDAEHIGITRLAIAEILISTGAKSEPDSLAYLSDAHTIFSKIGWIEGIARVLEQYAMHHWRHGQTDKALAAARESKAMFERIRAGRHVGRLEGLLALMKESS